MKANQHFGKIVLVDLSGADGALSARVPPP